MRAQQVRAKDAKIPYEQQLKAINEKITEANHQISALRVSLPHARQASLKLLIFLYRDNWWRKRMPTR